MSYNRNNIFAKILRGEAPAVRIHEDPQTLSFMDLFPQSYGHALVIPKYETETILDCPPETLMPLIAMTQRIALAVDKALNPDGIMIAQFNRAPAGQSVPHLHFHIIPRYAQEGLKTHFSAGNKADESDLARLAGLIKAAL